MKRHLIPALLAALLAGCAATADLPARQTFDATRDEGLAIVSLSLSGKDLGRVTHFEYRLRELVPSDKDGVVKRIHFGSPTQHARWVGRGDDARPIASRAVVKGAGLGEPLDISDHGKPAGRLATLVLPAGDYEFHAWNLVEGGPYGDTEYGPKREFSYRFSVKPGAAVYLGRLHLQLSDRDRQALTVEDRRDSDLAGFRSKYPALAQVAVAVAVGQIR